MGVGAQLGIQKNYFRLLLLKKFGKTKKLCASACRLAEKVQGNVDIFSWLQATSYPHKLFIYEE